MRLPWSYAGTLTPPNATSLQQRHLRGIVMDERNGQDGVPFLADAERWQIRRDLDAEWEAPATALPQTGDFIPHRAIECWWQR